jgi:site-specific DNA-cytosine methylase
MAEDLTKSKLVYHVWDKDNNEYDIPDDVVQERGMDNFAKDFEGGYITMFDNDKKKVDVPIEDVEEYRNQGYLWYDASGNATPINEVGKQVTTTEAKQQVAKPVAQPVAKPAAEKPKEDNRSWLTKWMTGTLPEDEEQETADKEPGLIAKALNMFPTGVKTSNGTYQPAPAIPQPTVKGEEMPVEVETTPSSANVASPESKEEVPASAAVVNNKGLMDAKLANYIENWKQRPDEEGDYFENMVADLLADGTANSNEEAVGMVKSALGRYANRSAMDVTNQVVSSLPDDTVQDAEKSIEAQWYSHGVQDKLKQEADNMGISYDDYVGLFLKPAMVQSLVNKYGPNYRDIAEGIATRLYSHDEHVQDRLMNQDINDAFSSVINKYVNPSVVDEYNKAQEAGSKAFTEGMEGSQFIPANLRLGTALGAQYEANEAKDPAKVLSGLQKKFGKLYRNPEFLNDMSNAAYKVVQRYGLNGTLGSDPKQFKPMINSVLKNELDQLEIKGMMPKGSAEYIMKTGLGNTIVGKITRKAVQTDYQNWLEDMANQQYQPGFWENVASGALTFAGDAWSYWLPGAAGGKLTKSMIAKAEGRLAGDLMAKGMERRVAERAAKVLIGKSKTEALKSGAVHGAVTFGGQSAISKPIDEVYRTGQFDENGKVYNPSVGKIIADTLGEVTKQSAVGAIMQGGTIANMIGKGRGLATNILADIGGKVADSGIMTGHQMLERMAQDPNFKPTGKDAAESFLESMANLTAIGLPGMMGKYARFKDAREFNKKYDFTDQDIAELKRFGYEDLRDAFEKVGIGEYAVEGENAQRLDGQLTQKYMNLMNDKSVPEVLKAKMMAVVEGKRPSSFSPVVDSIIVQPMDHDGKVYLETLNKDGGIIDRKEFSSLAEAQKADKKLEYEKTLGLASVLEGEFHNEFTQEHLDGLYNKAAQKYNMGEKLTDEDKAAVYLHQNAGAIKDIMDKQQKGIVLTEEEQKQVNAYRHYYDSALENSSVMREFVNTFEDSHGVARGTLRKALESKDKKYAPLVESYLMELYNSIELKREMKQTMDDLYNTAHGNEQKRIEGENPVSPAEGSAGGLEPPVSEGPAPYKDRTNSVSTPSDAEVAANPANVASSAAGGAGNEPKVASSEGKVASSENKVANSDAFVMGQEAYKNGDSGALQAIDYNSDLATGRLKRAFKDSDNMFDLVTKAYNDGRDMEQFLAQRASLLTSAQKEAISKYVEAMDAKKGAIDALQHADDGYSEALKQQLWQYQTEDGNIVPATLTSGRQVFLKKANEYGGGFVVVPDEQGQPTIKQVSDAEIKEVGTPVPLDDYIESSLGKQKEARAKQFLGQLNGAKKGDIVSVYPEGADSPMDLKIAGYTKDGKVVLTDVDVDVNSSIDPKKLVYASKEEFDTWRTNALNNTINERLNREDEERELAEIKRAEAEKQERYKKGIFGYAAGQPDYSDAQTDPKVAAEYLQETAGDDRKALFANIVAEKQALQKRINQLREHISSNEEWLSINADLDPKNAETRTLANKQMEGQIADLQARFDNWNKIRSAVMTPEEAQAIKADRTQKIADAGVNEGDVAPIEGREVAVLSDEELKKQYPTMDEASDFIASERKRIYRIQSDEVQREIDGVDEVLDRFVNGEIDLEPEQIKELNTTKAQLQARQANLTESAKELKAQADKLNTLYRKENMEARAKVVENLTPAEQRAIKVENAIKNGNMSQLNAIYDEVRGAIDFNDTEPNTLEEYVANSIGRFTLNYEGKEKGGAFSNGIQQETGLGRKDFDKLQILAKEGEGKTVPEFVHGLYDDMPKNLKQMGYTDQDIRSAFLDLIGSAQSYSDIKNYTLNNKVANVEQQMREVERQEEEMMEEATSYSNISLPFDFENDANFDSSEREQMVYKDGESLKSYMERNGTSSPDNTPRGQQLMKAYIQQKYADKLNDIDVAFGHGQETGHDGEVIAENVMKIADSTADADAMLYLLNTPMKSSAMIGYEQRIAELGKKLNNRDGAHSEAFDKIVELAKEQKEYWDLMEEGEVDPDDVPEVDVAHDMDELLKTLSDEEFKEVSDVLKGIDEEFEYFTANEYERREGVGERKEKAENANTYDESIKEALKPVTPVAIALKSAVESGDKKAIKQAQKELTDALIASDLGHDYLSGQLAQAKLAKKKDELYKVKRATIKPLTDAIHAIESAKNIEDAPFADRLKNAIAETETEPTEAQKKAGNYKKGHLTFGGYDFTVETPKGVTRSGKDEQGKPWSVTMHDTYGYILGKIGVDGDHIDMFINDAADLDTFDGNVCVVDQVNPETGEFDEHKVMYGYPDEAAATKAYLSNYSKGWKGLGKVTSVPKATFDKWLESSDRKTKPFADYAMIQHAEAQKAKETDETLPFGASMSMDNLPFHRDVKEVKPSDMTEAQKVAYDAVSTMLKKAGIPVKVVSNEDMEKVAEAQDNLNLAMLLNQPEMRFKIKTPEEKKAAENAYNFAKELRPDKWKQYAVVDMSNPNKMPEYFEKQELARKERSYYNKLMWGNYKVFNLDKSFEDNVAGLTGSFPSEFDPYKIDAQTSKKNELKKQMKEIEDAYNSTGQERNKYQIQLMKEYMDEHGLASENDIPDDVWSELDNKAHEKYQDKLDSLFAKYKDLDRQLKAIVQPGVRFLRTYHGTGASFDKFDLSHALEGEGSETFGHGVYVTTSREIGREYAQRAKQKKMANLYKTIRYPDGVKGDTLKRRLFGEMVNDVATGGDVKSAKEFAKKRVGADANDVERTLEHLKDREKGTEYEQNLKDGLAKYKDALKWIDSLDDDYLTQGNATRYEVEIPEDNGSNYLDWEKTLNEEQINAIRDALAKKGVDVSSWEKRGFKLDLTFKDVYSAVLPMMMRYKPEDVSKFLSSLGFTGIKYPAGMIYGGAKEGDYNYVIFDENNANIVGNTKFAQGKGVVYGYTDGKEIVLNQEHLNANTPIHEYQHLWRTAAKEMNPELIAHGDELIKQTQLFRDLKEDPNYKHLSDDEICDEAFARLTGEDGAAILEQMAKEAIKENPLDTAKELTIINRLKNWLKKFWYWTLDTFTKWKPEDIKKMTLEDIRNLVLRDLANGVDPRTVMNEKKEGSKLSKKEKDDATERIDKRIAELNRQEKEQSLKSDNGNLAESHDNGYLPSKDNLDGVQSVAPSSAKIDKKFPTKTFYLGNLANFITSMGKNADITAGNFTKKLFEGMGMTPHGKDTQVSEYFKYQTDDGGKTTVRLSDHSGNALSIIKKGGRADKGYSIVVRVDSSPKTKFKANKYSNVAEYVYENPNADGLKDIARSVFNLIDTGEYLDLAGANEVHVSPRNNDADKTLAGVHNITEEKLRKALKLGGLANPSLAVIDTSKSAHDNFGEISFIAPSALVDKRTGKTGGTWITDAYTQRYPSVEREMSEKGYRKFKDWVASLDYPSGAKAEIERQAKDALSDNNAPAWELMYLKEKGIDIKEYDSNINDYRWKEIISDHPTAEDILNSMKTDPELNKKVTSLAKYAIIRPTMDKISLEVRRKIYKETGVKKSPISPIVRQQTKEIFERDYKATLLNKDGSPRKKDVKKVVEDIVKEHNDTKKYDFYLSKVKASNYVNKNGLYDDYIRWQENKLDEFGTKNRIFRGYTKDGSRKYVPETLENVSKAMREDANGQTNGSEYTSFGSFIAKLASRVDSTDEMRANKDKLSSNKDKEEFYEKWESVYYDLAKSLYNDVFYGEQRLHDIVSQADPKKYAKKEYGITLSSSFMKKLDSLKNAVQNDLKSAYFETKFNRPVHLNEFVAAVVPSNLGEDVRKGLEESGLSLYDYDPEKEGDRNRAFNEAINSNNEIRFHRVTEPEELERLNKEKTFRMYSGMQEVDGKLYSPMAAIIDGKRTDATEIGAWMGADERPDLVKGGKFQLVKTDKNPGAGEGPVRAAYNPYMHTSTSMMNDQFTGAYARGNIKVVEWEIPESEKTSGYRAEGAKDAVGLVPWHSGSVNGLLPKDRQRSVMLSRWRKAVRVVPDAEVAESIAEQLEGTGLAIPWNVVTPNQVRELVKLGVPITTVESGQQAPETKEKFMAQMEELKNEFPQAQFVDVKMTKDAFKEWGGKGLVQSPIVKQKLKKHPDSLMKAGTYFSGGGLVEEGLKGIIDPVVAVEYDRKISGVYRNNFGQHIVTADVRDVDPKELVKQIDGEVEYFHASPVCKNYSQAKTNGGEVELDKETAKSTADFIDAVKPRVVTIENVKGYKDSEAMKIITQALDKNGYTWDADVYNAADFGGYTNRERLIVRAVKDGEQPEKPKKQPRKSGWLEAVEDILPTLKVKEKGVAPWMDARLKADGIDWQKVEKPLYVMGSAYADGKIPHAYGDEILPTLRTKSGDVIIMPGGKVLRADGRVLARITGLGDDYLLPKTESLAHTIIGNGIPVQLTQGVIAPLLNKDDLSGRNVLARLGKSIFKNDWDADKQKKVSEQVVNTANKLGGVEATVYTSVDEVPDAYLSDVMNGATGWYDPTTHTVHVYLPNCADANEAERTVLHEKIGHEGMEVLLGGEDEVRKFANFVYNSVAASTRGKILEIANEYDPNWKKHDRMNVGTQEYIARLAEEGPKTAEDFSLWTKIKHYLIKVLKKLGIRVPGLLNDKDLRYYLMKAGKALHVWDDMPEAQQEAMMKQASNAEIKDSLGEGVGKGKPRQKKGESMIQYMKRVQEWRKWKDAREDENDPEPPMFYDIDKDEAGKKEWELLNKEWRDRHHLAGEEPTGMPVRMKGETDDAYMTRIHDYEKWKDAMKDDEDPIPDMFDFEKSKQEEVKRKYEDWLARHELLEQQQADLDLYEGKIYPAETNPKADDLEQQVMQDLAEVTSTDVSKEGAAKTVKHAVIHRRKNMEEASADDAIYINDVKNRIEKMAGSGVFDKLLSDYKGKANRAEKLAEAIPYIIEAPRRLRDLAHDLNATGAFDKGHIHIQPEDVEAIQPYVADLIAETAKQHSELKDDKEVVVYDDPLAVGEVASKMAQAINNNHQGEEGFVPIDGSDIMSEHVLPLVMQQIVPDGIDYKNLSPEMKAALDSIRDWYNYTYDWLKDNRTLKEDTGYNADYVNHIWDKEKSDKQAYAMYVENRQRTKSPNEKPRTISTLMEGISVGLVPKTTDITKMMAYYSRSNIEAWVNKTMLQELSGLNVIERNEDGEVVSTDPLLSSSAPFNLEQYKYFEIPGLGPVWVYKGNAKDYTIPNIITGKKILLYRQKSAAKRFGVVFEQYESSPFWETVDTLASSAKKLELGFSGFHAGALTEVYMVQNMVEFGPKKAMANFMKYIFADTMKNHELPCFANPEDFQEAASHLVKFGATNDYAAADVQNMFDNLRDAMMKVQEKLKDGNGISGMVAVATMPLKVVTQLLSLVNKGMDRALWNFLHDGLKLATYRMRADKTKVRAKKKGWTEEELSRALDEDGQFVNDMFGGQHWDVLGASHRTLRYAGRVLLSPDWNASTTRHFLALSGYGSIWNEATFENFKLYYQRLWHKELMPEDEGRRGRQISALLCYGIGFMVFYEAFANGINAAFRAMDESQERKKAEEMRKTNPDYKSMYELAYGDEGMKWYDYLMRGNSLGQQSKIFLGRYADGTEMYIRHGKQFREVPEYLFNHKGELEFPGPMVQRMIGKANPMVRMTLDDINYLSDFQASHADQEIQRKYGKSIGLLYKDALYWAPFLIPSQENKEFKAVDFFFPSSKGFSPWKAQSYFKDFILSGDMEGVVMTYQSCKRNGIDAEAQIKAAIGSVKALETAEMKDGVTSLQVACQRFDAAKSITEKKKMRQKMKKFLSMSDYKAFTQKEALDMVQGYLNGEEDLKEMEKADSKYLMAAKAEDVTEDWRIQNAWNGTMEAYEEYQRLKDIDKAKANAFKNSKTNKRLFAARKAISAAKRKMNKAKKQMDGTNGAAKMVEIRKTRKELIEKLNGME